MSLLPEEFHRRASLALQAFQGTDMPPVAEAEVERFFTKYPELDRTKLAEAFITSLVLERLSTTAGDPAAQLSEKKTA